SRRVSQGRSSFQFVFPLAGSSPSNGPCSPRQTRRFSPAQPMVRISESADAGYAEAIRSSPERGSSEGGGNDTDHEGFSCPPSSHARGSLPTSQQLSPYPREYPRRSEPASPLMTCTSA